MEEKLETNEDKIKYINEIIEKVPWKILSIRAEDMAIDAVLKKIRIDKNKALAQRVSYNEPKINEEKIKKTVHPTSGEGNLIRYDGKLYNSILVVGLEECVMHDDGINGIMAINLKPNFDAIDHFKAKKYRPQNLPELVKKYNIIPVKENLFFDEEQCKYEASVPEGVIKVSHVFNVATNITEKSDTVDKYIDKEFKKLGRVIGAVRTELMRDRYLPL
ncbi:MAG: hypothetical protein KJ968_00580 [Nanoarchaeota archaeon]|nr:hypothetical protein [Nanoarchaeota archaeon]